MSQNEVIYPLFWLHSRLSCDSATIEPTIVQNPDCLVDSKTAYLFAFRTNEKNKAIYYKYGFTEYIKEAQEVYPDGTTIDVE